MHQFENKRALAHNVATAEWESLFKLAKNQSDAHLLYQNLLNSTRDRVAKVRAESPHSVILLIFYLLLWMKGARDAKDGADQICTAAGQALSTAEAALACETDVDPGSCVHICRLSLVLEIHRVFAACGLTFYVCRQGPAGGTRLTGAATGGLKATSLPGGNIGRGEAMGAWTPFSGSGVDPWRVQAPAGEVVLPGVSPPHLFLHHDFSLHVFRAEMREIWIFYVNYLAGRLGQERRASDARTPCGTLSSD